MATCLFAAVGIGCALVARFAATRPARRRLALVQIGAVVAFVGVAAYGHCQVMRRTTELTGSDVRGCLMTSELPNHELQRTRPSVARRLAAERRVFGGLSHGRCL